MPKLVILLLLSIVVELGVLIYLSLDPVELPERSYHEIVELVHYC